MAVSNTTRVAPPRLSVEPNPTMPTIVASIGGPCSRTLARWPRVKSYFDAVDASMAISLEVVGARPCRRVSALISGSLVQLVPSVGAPPVVTASPFLSTSWA